MPTYGRTASRQSAHIETTLGQAAVIGGSRIDQPDGILVEEPTSRFARGRSRGRLYTLIELSGRDVARGAGQNSLVSQLAWIVRDVYYSQRGSVTAGLQMAIRGVNGVLFDENRNSLPSDRRTAGITCVVLRDDDLFIAQAGPAAAFVRQGGQVIRYPEVSPWLDDVSMEEVDAAFVGDRRDVQVDLYHAQVAPGDGFLLVNAALARSLSPQASPAVLAEPSTEEALERLIASSAGQDLSALVVQLGAEGQAAVAAAPESAGFQAPAAGGAADSAAEPLGARAWDQVSQGVEQLRLGERLRTAGRALAAAFGALSAVLLTLLRRMMPDRTSSQPTVQRQTTTVTVSRTKQKERRRSGAGGSNWVQKLLIVLAVAIPVVVAIVVLVVTAQRGHTRQVEIDTLTADANRAWQQAQAATVPAQVRAYLLEADGYLQKLIDRRPDDTTAADLARKVQARLDEIDQVRRISWLARLRDYPSGANLSRVVVEGAHVFVLDRNGKIYHHELDDFQQALKPETVDTVLVSKGQQVGNVLVADLVDMVWVPVGETRQKANLVILESGGHLLEYDPSTDELRPISVAGTGDWQYPSLVGSYYGRFYVLDSTANKIWRYQPTADGYSNPPDDWLQSDVDLLGVTDMAIGNSIYLLYGDGRLAKLTVGEPDTFDISDWDVPPRDPSALYTRPPDEMEWIYVADRGNNRIMQIAKDGKFKRQFRLADSAISGEQDPLGGVTSLFVDEISAHAFFLSGGSLYISVLPE
jgi:hypothetical protein